MSYKFTPHIMTYATASEGFRPGGANNIPSLPQGLVAYQSDSLWNYELGLKSSWLGGMLTADAAVFDIEWQNIQTSATTANGIFSFITNAGAARIRGTEVETTVRPIEGLTLNGGVSYTDARLTQNQANSNILLTGTTGLAGDRLPNVPDWTATLSGNYNWLINDKLNGMVRGGLRLYRPDAVRTFRPTASTFVSYGNYSSLNLRVGIENEHRGVYLFVDNVTNTVGVTGVSSGVGYSRYVFSIPPRTIGLNVRAGF